MSGNSGGTCAALFHTDLLVLSTSSTLEVLTSWLLRMCILVHLQFHASSSCHEDMRYHQTASNEWLNTGGTADIALICWQCRQQCLLHHGRVVCGSLRQLGRHYQHCRSKINISERKVHMMTHKLIGQNRAVALWNITQYDFHAKTIQLKNTTFFEIMICWCGHFSSDSWNLI